MSNPGSFPIMSFALWASFVLAGSAHAQQPKILASATPVMHSEEGLGSNTPLSTKARTTAGSKFALVAPPRRRSTASMASRGTFPYLGPLPRAPRALDLRGRSTAELFSMLKQGLDREDPGLALAAARAITLHEDLDAEDSFKARLGLGKAWLLLGEASTAEAYARQLLGERKRAPKAWALYVRAGLRSGDFSGALLRSRQAVRMLGFSDLALRTAHASALFRNGELKSALDHYKVILSLDPKNIEAEIRLGTGLLPRADLASAPELDRSLALIKKKDYSAALEQILTLLRRKPMHPVALRMAGELQLARQRAKSPLVAEGSLEQLWSLLRLRGGLVLDLSAFYPDLYSLQGSRKEILTLSSIPFQRGLARVALNGGSHDILMERERTTDAPSRRWLKGKRTFDGRSWDDVRGIGGLSAATGIEALDEAHGGGFQTLVHELAHQVHHYALRPAQKKRIRTLYLNAEESSLFLDYYAASNEAEYFAQGVEAYFSYLKSAGQPLTHGHTHFELLRRDPELAAFISRIVEWDPLAGPERMEVLARAFRAALRVGRVEDASTILDMIPAGRLRKDLSAAVALARNLYRTL